MLKMLANFLLGLAISAAVVTWLTDNNFVLVAVVAVIGTVVALVASKVLSLGRQRFDEDQRGPSTQHVAGGSVSTIQLNGQNARFDSRGYNTGYGYGQPEKAPSGWNRPRSEAAKQAASGIQSFVSMVAFIGGLVALIIPYWGAVAQGAGDRFGEFFDDLAEEYTITFDSDNENHQHGNAAFVFDYTDAAELFEIAEGFEDEIGHDEVLSVTVTPMMVSVQYPTQPGSHELSEYRYHEASGYSEADSAPTVSAEDSESTFYLSQVDWHAVTHALIVFEDGILYEQDRAIQPIVEIARPTTHGDGITSDPVFRIIGQNEGEHRSETWTMDYELAG